MGRFIMRKYAIPVLVVGIIAVAAGGMVWWQTNGMRLPPGVASANGRIEVERFDIATKLPGRMREIRVKEGDTVAKGAVVAEMDVADLLAQKASARALINRATQGIVRAGADVASAEANLALAEVQMQRSAELLDKAVSPQALLDQRRAQRDVAAAAVQAARAAVADAEAAKAVAEAQLAQIDANLADMTLTAPVAGRVEYRLADSGAVLGAGGKVATLLDLTDVTMTVFLPTRLVGRVKLGAPARIVLDAAPDWVIPASVSFIAAEAQFTPKAVETADERDKLMYRVKVRIDPALLEVWRDYVKSGLTGNVYLLTAPDARWPASLEPRLPKPGEAQSREAQSGETKP
jgi:HlyD family secretion protein